MAGYSRGDTIIEVLFAITVFSLVSVGGLSVMNQGTALAQRSLEIGLVREQIDGQADALRFLNSSYITDYGKNGPASKLWNDIVTNNALTSGAQAQQFDQMTDGANCLLPHGQPYFALDLTKLDSNPLLSPTADAITYARVNSDNAPTTAEGLWIQAVSSPNSTYTDSGKQKPGFYDFHIRACWHTPGQTTPITLGTIVRLYEPRG
ncbi:MAG: hypothetical protein H6797_05300 [Candidatus Nomurabacteria bacterium]|nr:MAG: hypothetical protein H6797_05300 [Candidatus Nomurabacteria bacterium]